MAEPFDTKDSSRFEEFGKKVDERFNQTLPRVEEGVKKVIAYLNDQVVPQLRQDSSQCAARRRGSITEVG